MKCSALRDTVKRGTTPCGMLGKPEHEGFCSYEHHEQAKKYSGVAYDKHVASYKSFLGKKDLFRVFNEDLRPVFQSVLEAGKKHEREQILKTVGVDYANMAKSAWQTVDAVKTEVGKLLEPTVKEAREAVQSAKRMRQHTSLTDIIRKDTDEDDATYSLSSSPKKSKTQMSPRHVPLPEGDGDGLSSD